MNEFEKFRKTTGVEKKLSSFCFRSEKPNVEIWLEDF